MRDDKNPKEIRVGNYENKYWVEGKIGGKWYQLPHLVVWDEWDWFPARIEKKRIPFFDSFESAREIAVEYLRRYCAERVSVYVTPKW